MFDDSEELSHFLELSERDNQRLSFIQAMGCVCVCDDVCQTSSKYFDYLYNPFWLPAVCACVHVHLRVCVCVSTVHKSEFEPRAGSFKVSLRV